MAQPARRSAARTRQVIDPDDRERAAIAAGLRLMAELMAEIGWTTRFNQLTEPQARALAEAAIDGFLEAMALSARAPRSGGAVLMDGALDFNHREKPPAFVDEVNALIDQALVAENATRPQRDYLGGSRLGESCSRRLQYEYLKAPKDAGAEFSGQSLRIFALGHVLEDLAIEWLRKAGFDLRVRNRHGEQFGFSAAGGRVQGHADGVVVAAPNGMAVPALWECKSANAKNWRDIVKRGVRVAKPIYAAQIALYQAYLGLTEAPALFTAINKDTCEIWHELVPFDGALAQASSDKAVQILRACDAGELLPRHTADPEHFECRFCAWKERCWA